MKEGFAYLLLSVGQLIIRAGKTFDDPVISFDAFATALAASGQTIQRTKV